MRNSIAKRKRKELMKAGATSLAQEYISDPGWERKQCGYSVRFKYNGWTCTALGYDLLDAYKAALDTLDCMQEPPRGIDGPEEILVWW